VDHSFGPGGSTDTWDSVLPRLQDALFGDFIISRELGRGGMAAVFLAHQIKLDRKVAIKVMAPTLLSGLGLSDRFRDEATTVARLDHPNVISIYEIGNAAGLQYFIMQYVDGRSLERVLRQYTTLPVAIVRAILFEVGAALAYAHRREVIHRDVKPGNILLSLDGRVIVGDFGIAKVAASSSRTQTGAVVGTPAYMSPEQCWGRPLTWSADQYALGIVAFEMLTGAPPFNGAAFAVMRGHTEESVPELLPRRPDCPPDMADAVRRMLAKRPEDRFPSMSAALSALGASRMAVDDAAQATIGQLAIRLADEEGVVLVHTPVSPVPQHDLDATPLSPSPGTVRPRAAPLGEWLARAARASADRIAAAGRALTAHSQGAAAAVVGASRSVYHQGVRTPAGRWVTALSAAGLVALTAIALIVRPRSVVVPEATDRARITQPPIAPPYPDSAIVAAGADSLVTAQEPDSLTTAPDSSLPSSITFARVASRIVEVGDSTQLDAIVRDLRKTRLETPRITWSVSDTTRLVRTASGWLRARAPGFVRVTARIDTLRTSIQLNVIPRSVPRTAEQDARPLEPNPTNGSDALLEQEAVHRAVTAFIESVLNGRNIERIRERYLTSSPADIESRDAFIARISGKRNVSVHGQADPPAPAIVGTRATASTRITRAVRRTLMPDEVEQLILHAELTKSADGWDVTGFRVGPWGSARQ
jgi:serine/threonine-protein kinase